ncbi:DMT family transporter [Acinetobacter tianfuensis]|uniref:DMT family transporter n=1 Tax=Acinetobacter tianfuensis TaxID=2419603 RepID=A0A3A8EUY9_9GAMM|nr:DMT family transporter [Acinetobacter tianfuensis]RKG32243.1 DMT family transporter [Acinetobacter tianfuensis]
MQVRQALDAKASSIMFVLCIFWGLQQVVVKLAAADIAPMMQMALRSGLSALLVFPLIKLAQGQSLWSKQYRVPGALVGLLFAIEFCLLSEALRLTSASHAVVLLYTAPIFVALGLHWKLPAEHLTWKQWSGILLAFFGIVVTFMGRGAEAVEQDLGQMILGDLLALGAGVFWAATTIAVRLTNLSEAPATQTLFYQLFGGFAVLLPMAFLLGQSHVYWTAVTISSLLFHALLISFASYLIWFWLLKRYLASRLGVFSFLTPLFGIAFGVLILDEPLEQAFIAGTLMVMAGVLTVSLAGRKKVIESA